MRKVVDGMGDLGMLKCDVRELAEALSALEPVVRSKLLQADERCVLLETSQASETAVVRATGNEMAASINLERFELLGEGSTFVPVSTLLSVVKSIEAETLRIELDDRRLTVKGGGATFRLMAQPTSRFVPMAGPAASIAMMDVGQASMRRLLTETGVAMTDLEGRETIVGTVLDADGFALTATAGNGRVFGRSTADGVCDVRGSHRAIVPPKAVDAVLRMLGDDGDMQVLFGGNHVGFAMRSGRAMLWSSLVAARVPPIESLFVAQAAPVVTVGAARLATAMRQASLMADPARSSGAIVDVQDGRLSVSSRSDAGGESAVELEGKVDGPPIRFSVNPASMIGAINACDAGDAEIKLECGAPNLLRMVLGNGTQYVIGKMSMPKEGANA